MPGYNAIGQPGCNSSPDCGCTGMPCAGCPPFHGLDGPGTGSPPQTYVVTLYNSNYPWKNLNGCYSLTLQGSITSTEDSDFLDGISSGQVCCWWSNAPAPGDWTSVPDTPDGWEEGPLGNQQVPRLDLFLGTNDPVQPPGSRVKASLVVWDKANGYMVVFGYWSAFPLVSYESSDAITSDGFGSFPVGVGFGGALAAGIVNRHFAFEGARVMPVATSVTSVEIDAIDLVDSGCVLVAARCDSGKSVSGVTDDAGNTYTQVTQYAGLAGNEEIWIASGVDSFPDNNITVSFSGTVDALVSVTQYSGVSSETPVNSTVHGSASSATTITSPTFAPDPLTAMVVGFGWNKNTAQTYTVNALFALRSSGNPGQFSCIEDATGLNNIPGTPVTAATYNVSTADDLDIIGVVLNSSTAQDFPSCTFDGVSLPMYSNGTIICDSGGEGGAALCEGYSAWLLGFSGDGGGGLVPNDPPFGINDPLSTQCFISRSKCLGDCCGGTLGENPGAVAVNYTGTALQGISDNRILQSYSETFSIDETAGFPAIWDAEYSITGHNANGAAVPSPTAYSGDALPGAYCAYFCGTNTEVWNKIEHSASGDLCMFAVDGETVDPSLNADCVLVYQSPCEEGEPCGLIQQGHLVIIGRNGTPPSGPIYIYASIWEGLSFIEYGTPFYATSNPLHGTFTGGFKPDASPDTVATIDDCLTFSSITLKAFKQTAAKVGVNEDDFGDPTPPLQVFDIPSDSGITAVVSVDLSGALPCANPAALVDLEDCCDGATSTVQVDKTVEDGTVIMADDNRCYSVAAATGTTASDNKIVRAVSADCSDCLSAISCCCEEPIDVLGIFVNDFVIANFPECEGCFLSVPGTAWGINTFSTPCSADPLAVGNSNIPSGLSGNDNPGYNCPSGEISLGFNINKSTCKVSVTVVMFANSGLPAVTIVYYGDMPTDNCGAYPYGSPGYMVNLPIYSCSSGGGAGIKDREGRPLFLGEGGFNSECSFSNCGLFFDLGDCGE